MLSLVTRADSVPACAVPTLSCADLYMAVLLQQVVLSANPGFCPSLHLHPRRPVHGGAAAAGGACPVRLCAAHGRPPHRHALLQGRGGGRAGGRILRTSVGRSAHRRTGERCNEPAAGSGLAPPLASPLSPPANPDCVAFFCRQEGRPARRAGGGHGRGPGGQLPRQGAQLRGSCRRGAPPAEPAQQARGAVCRRRRAPPHRALRLKRWVAGHAVLRCAGMSCFALLQAGRCVLWGGREGAQWRRRKHGKGPK